MRDNFKKILYTVFIFLIILILILLGLNLGLTSKVKDITITGGENSADINKQVINLTFTHPVQKKDIENNISFSPIAAFGLNWINNKNLQIRFKESLNSNTEYILKIIKDKDSIAEDYVFNFKTKSLSLIYLEKSEDESISRIIKTDSNFEKREILFEKEKIRLFSKNKNYLAAVTLDEDKTNSLFLINLKSKEIQQIDIGASLVNTISFSPNNDEFLFTRSNAVQRGSDIVPSKEYSLNIFKVSENKFNLINPQNSAIYILEAGYTPDGSAIYYKTDADLYYLVDTEKYENLLSFGKHDKLGEFNFERNKIVFNDVVNLKPTLILYNTNKQISPALPENIYPVDPIFKNNSDEIIYAQKVDNKNPAVFQFEIKSVNSAKQITSILSEKDKSLESPKISPDDKYIVIERFNSDRKINPKDFRVTGFQIKPGIADLIIYDLIEQKVVDKNIRGVNAIWEVE